MAPIAWLGVIAYAFQIYFDFSGYSDMAIGLGRMFGFRFPENFNSPYRSKSITEFWRRWHISLSSFLRDYLYIPLGGNRGSSGRTYVNLMMVMLIGGLWHGAQWTWVFFRAANFEVAASYLGSMFGFGGDAPAAGILTGELLRPMNFFFLALAVIVTWVTPRTANWLEKLTGIKVAIGLVLFVISLAMMFTQGFNPFLYFQF